MKKGFTLLEMLAVIVVISILSLIMLPDIAGQFADKKEEISKVSQQIILSAAELYANETGNTYQTITINDLVEAGKLEQPIIDQKTRKEIPLTKQISIDASGNACIVGIDGCDKIKHYKEYENGEIVYYNPETKKKCEKANSTTGTKSGCMKWYVFNDDGENAAVNVILDHNTTTNVAWRSTKTTLENDTSNWKSDLNPRLITANDVAKITGNTGWDASKGEQSRFFLDSNNQAQTASSTKKSKYDWLFDYTNDCARFGCNTQDSSTDGYWTSTPYMTSSYGSNTGYAWVVNYSGSLEDTHVDGSGRNYGIRPVITISKSDV